MSPPRWLHWPTAAPSSAFLTLATTTGWTIDPEPSVRTAVGFVAGPAGPDTTGFLIRSDSFAGFLYFVDQTARDAWRSLYASYTTLRITDGSANVYENTACTFDTFTSDSVVLRGSWTGTLPTNSASIIEIAP